MNMIVPSGALAACALAATEHREQESIICRQISQKLQQFLSLWTQAVQSSSMSCRSTAKLSTNATGGWTVHVIM